ncbi:alpha/beta fold hydrolase [Streptomyces sp. NPDC050504]|uniref:alpha/beta fold hydrolase n=1 Tax=Streptomyces sp. NPDC050504 TaxID=3365618 RepID=UPI0037B0B5F2
MNTNTHVKTVPNTGRRALPVLLALAAATALTAPAALAAPGTAAAKAPRPSLAWGPCPKGEPPHPSPKAQCATVEVPVDWSRPDGPKTDIFVARHRATGPAKRIGVLMSNPGGPGAPGADDALRADDPYDGYSPAMLQRFDVIGFDPRGIARSAGAVCDESLIPEIPLRPRDAAGFQRLRALNGKLAESCLKGTGPLAAHMDSESVARDMDAIRAALGEDRISFLGHSYGTALGRAYARLFPARLRALALDSAVDPGRPDAERFLTDGSVAAEKAFLRVADWCAKNADCGSRGKPLGTVVDELFARADAGTLRRPGPQGPTREKVDADQLSDFLTERLGEWQPRDVAREILALHTGRGEARWGTGAHEIAWRLVMCRDHDFRIRDQRHYRAVLGRVAKAAPHVRHNSMHLDMIMGCQGWPMPPKPAPAQAQGALPPVLVVNAALDLATPLPGARRMARSFPEATLLTRDTVGHWLYRVTPADNEPRRAIDAYLSSRKD